MRQADSCGGVSGAATANAAPPSCVELVQLMCRQPALQHAPLRNLARLAAHVQTARFHRGAVILEQHEIGAVHFLVAGSVHITHRSSSSLRAVPQPGLTHDAAPETAPPPHPHTTIMATRGAGSVLGDDVVRDRSGLSVGVVAAEDGVVTLHATATQLAALLDPLTLRLLGRLRQQQDDALQQLLDAAAETAHAQLAATGHASAQEALRSAGLAGLGASRAGGASLVAPRAAARSTATAQPPWHAVRSKAEAPPQRQRRARAEGAAEAADAAWAAQLPLGVQPPDKSAGLPQTASVRELLCIIRDSAEHRRMHATSSAEAGCARAAAGNTAAAPMAASVSRLCASSLLEGGTAARRDAAAAAGDTSCCSASSCHTELLHGCCVAVLEVQEVAPQPEGAPSGGLAALAGALDDVASSWVAAAYDTGLQLVRWGPTTTLLLAPGEPGTPDTQAMEVAAEVLLAAAARLAGVMGACRDDGVPCVRLAAGLAAGSCFVQYQASSFVCAVSGPAHAAAQQLCLIAQAESTSSTSSNTRSATPVLLVTGELTAQLASSFVLQGPPDGGSHHQLLGGRPVLPSSTASGSRPGTAASMRGSSQAALGGSSSGGGGRATLGPGRHTVLGLGGPAGFLGVLPSAPQASQQQQQVPKTPGGARLLARAGGRAHLRRKLRRQIEAMSELLARSSDMMAPPPPHMLTQPPPPGGWPAAGPAAAAGAAQGRPRAVNFAGVPQPPDGPAAGASSSGVPSLSGRRPRLTVVLDPAGAAGWDSAAGSSPTMPAPRGGSSRPGSPGPGPNTHRQQAGGGVVRSAAAPPAAAAAHPGPASHASRPAAHAVAKVSRPACRTPGTASVHAAAAAGPAAHSACGSSPVVLAAASGSGGRCGGSTSGVLAVRQQVWREVAVLRSLPGGGSAASSSHPGSQRPDHGQGGCAGARPWSPFLLP